MAQRGKAISRKRPTQVELERENSELKRRVQQLEKRLKQAVRHINKEHDAQLDYQMALDFEEEQKFNDIVKRAVEPEDPDEGYIVFTLPNGQKKRFKKTTSDEQTE